VTAPVLRPRVAPGPRAQAEPRTARIALFGASGYSGQEFARLALRHPGLRLQCLVSRQGEARAAEDVLVGIDPRTVEMPPVVDLAGALVAIEHGEVDLVVACLPHGVWKQLVREHPALHGALPGPVLPGVAANGREPLRVIDLSSDHRTAPGYVYGLPEAFRALIPGAVRIANPGCYPTAAMLALLPALEEGWVAGPVTVTALSGISGAGRGASLRTSFVEREGGAEMYKAGTVHGHVPEMVNHLSRVADVPVAVGFAPQIVPMARGILLTANAELEEPVDPERAWRHYRDRYADERFVRLLPADTWPDTRAVRGSNRCDVAVTTMHGGRTLLATAAIDNLVKGAAGQAIQNLNLVLAWPEETGLPVEGVPW
jgi:N-acetyl-gamma-glutamyl-phosphate reductase